MLLRKVEGGLRRLSLGSVASRRIDDIRRQCHALMAEPQSDLISTPAHEVLLFRDFVAGPWKNAHWSSYKPWTRKGVQCAFARQLLPVFGATPLGRITRNQILR